MKTCSICQKPLGEEFNWLDSKSFKSLKIVCESCRNTYSMLKNAPEPTLNKHCKKCGKVIRMFRKNTKDVCWRCIK